MYFNKSILVLFILLNPALLKAQTQKKVSFFLNDENLVVLKGNVKQMATIPMDENSPNSGQDYHIVDVNEQGDLTTITTGFHGIVYKTYYVTTYSANGRKIETRVYTYPYDHDSFLQDTLLNIKNIDTGKRLMLTYSYNTKNELTGYVFNPGKKEIDSTIYVYNDEGNLIERDHYDDPKLLMDVTKYKYDSDNNLIELNQFFRGHLTLKEFYEYNTFDSKNNWLDATVHAETYYGAGSKQTYKIRRKITYY